MFFVTGGGGRCDDFESTPPPRGPRGGRGGREEEGEEGWEEGREGGREGGVGVVGLGSGLVGEERRNFFNSLFRNSVENEVKGGRRTRRTRRLSPSFLALPSSYPSSASEGREGEEAGEDIGLWVQQSKTEQMNFTDPKMRQEMIEKNYVPPSFLLAAEAMLLAVKGGEGGREGGADIPRGARGWGPPKSGAGGRSSRRWGRGRNWGEGGREGEEGEGDGETNRNIDCMCSYRAWSFLKD